MRQQLLEHHQEWLQAFVAWAERRPDIRALALARNVMRPADDEYCGGLDLIAFVRDPGLYIASEAWLDEMAGQCMTFVEPGRRGRNAERRLIFDCGVDVCLAALPGHTPATQLVSIRRRLALLARLEPGSATPSHVQSAVAAGLLPLIDRDGLLQGLSLVSTSIVPQRRPNETEYRNVVREFHYHAVWMAQRLQEGDLRRAKACCDGAIKRLLQRMLDWHAAARPGHLHAQGHTGQGQDERADPRTLRMLNDCEGRYDGRDLMQALVASLGLFAWMATETAQHLGYAYPHNEAERAERWAREAFAGGKGASPVPYRLRVAG